MVTKNRLAAFILALGLLSYIQGRDIGTVFFLGWCVGALVVLAAWGLAERIYDSE